MPRKTSPAMQDYLKGLCLLEDERPTARAISTQLLSSRLGVSAASATNMLKKLDSMGLVRHVPYRGAELTAAGRKVGLEMIRHHRLLETYLAEALGVPWDEVHKEAEVLEHVLSEDLEDRISALLGNPDIDPHGHPIPGKDGSMPRTSNRRLWDVSEGERVEVERVSDAEAEALRYLAGAGIRPGSGIEVLNKGPVGGPLFVRVEGGSDEAALSRELAETVWVG